jgi:hypothetical protein
MGPLKLLLVPDDAMNVGGKKSHEVTGFLNSPIFSHGAPILDRKLWNNETLLSIWNS